MIRRHFLQGALAAGALAHARPARAATLSGRDLNFVFITCAGGWDTTRVFAPLIGSPYVSMEADAKLATAGALSFVDHPDRPSVAAFFDLWHARTVLLHGIVVQAVSHPSSLRRTLCGSRSGSPSDWPSLLAAPRADLTAPNLVMSGPSYPGPLADLVCRTGASGQLGSLLDGSLGGRSDMPVTAPSEASAGAVNAYLRSRAARVRAGAAAATERELYLSFERGLAFSEDLIAARDAVNWGASSFTEQAVLAAQVIGAGLSRCVTLNYALYDWDTHGANDYYQTRNFEGLFAELTLLMQSMSETPGQLGGSVADETLIVVLSEMARTPVLNATNGKDHWPYTSAMLIGPNLNGDQMIGSYDQALYGSPINVLTGELDPAGDDISPDILGATLLALGDVDPGEALPGVPVLASLAPSLSA